MTDRRVIILFVLFTLMMLCLALAVHEARAEDFQVSTSLSLGVSTMHDCPFVDIQLAAGCYGFTLYGGVLTDVLMVEKLSFVPIRSIYSIGFKYQWEWLTLGWYHECTHKGDGASYYQWEAMWRPTEDNLYVTFTFKR